MLLYEAPSSFRSGFRGMRRWLRRAGNPLEEVLSCYVGEEGFHLCVECSGLGFIFFNDNDLFFFLEGSVEDAGFLNSGEVGIVKRGIVDPFG